jgi:site-specific DNA recombinase
MPIRFAILAGVSTDAQAREEKQSIPDQIKHCRARIESMEGVETAGPYIMDGYSRTGYDSLDLAMSEIPPLGEAVRSATNNQYDVLIMDNFDRLGDLGVIVKTRFKKIRKQLYSVRQSGKIADPATYDPYASEDADIAMYVEGIIQSYRINKLRRGWNVGIPARAAEGLHPLSIPYGYKAASPGQPAEQVPEQIAFIRQLKDWYLDGHAAEEIVRRANFANVPSPRGAAWSRTTIKGILHNPYYAGITVFGKQRKEGEQRLPQPPSGWVRGNGLHTPIWDEATYHTILAETERRNRRKQKHTHIYQLTSIVYCDKCGSITNRHGSSPWHYISCKDKHCFSMRYNRALQLVADEVVAALHRYNDSGKSVETTQYDQKIALQQKTRNRIQEGFEEGLYTALEAKRKIVSIEMEIERLTHARESAQSRQSARDHIATISRTDLARLRTWIENDDPTQVNKFLTSICARITLHSSGKVTVKWLE